MKTIEAPRKRPPRKFKKVVITKAGRLLEWALVSERVVKQYRVVSYGSFRNIRAMVFFQPLVIIPGGRLGETENKSLKSGRGRLWKQANLLSWPAPNEWFFIARLIEHFSVKAEVMGSNLVGVPTFFLVNLQLLKLLFPLRQSYLHLNLYFRSFHFMNRLITYFVMTHRNESVVNLISNMFIYLFVQVFIIFFVVIGVFWLDLYKKKRIFL